MVGDESVTPFRWENPPEAVHGGGRQHRPIADALKAKPMEWAVLDGYDSPRSASSLAYTVRNGLLPAYAPAKSFEAVARTLGKGQYVVYLRYLGVPNA